MRCGEIMELLRGWPIDMMGEEARDSRSVYATCCPEDVGACPEGIPPMHSERKALQSVQPSTSNSHSPTRSPPMTLHPASRSVILSILPRPVEYEQPHGGADAARQQHVESGYLRHGVYENVRASQMASVGPSAHANGTKISFVHPSPPTPTGTRCGRDGMAATPASQRRRPHLYRWHNVLARVHARVRNAFRARIAPHMFPLPTIPYPPSPTVGDARQRRRRAQRLRPPFPATSIPLNSRRAHCHRVDSAPVYGSISSPRIGAPAERFLRGWIH
eukprot:ctg_950.g434